MLSEFIGGGRVDPQAAPEIVFTGVRHVAHAPVHTHKEKTMVVARVEIGSIPVSKIPNIPFLGHEHSNTGLLYLEYLYPWNTPGVPVFRRTPGSRPVHPLVREKVVYIVRLEIK